MPPADVVPHPRDHEFFVDYEYMTNVNVDFVSQWPTLEGCEMVFMIGIGWDAGGQWHVRRFVTQEESHAAERAMFTRFLECLFPKRVGKRSFDPGRPCITGQRRRVGKHGA